MTANVILAGLGRGGYPPQPSSDPFAPPTITHVVSVPTGIGWTDGSNCATLHANMVAANPDGTEFDYPGPLYSYNFATSANIDSRSNLLFSGNGTRINNTGNISNAAIGNSAFVVGRFAGGSNHITIDDFVLNGANPSGGTTAAYHIGAETASGVMIFNRPSFIEVKNCVITNQWGHGLYQGSGGSGAINAPQYTWLHDNTISDNGVMGINTACATYTWVQRNTLRDISIYPIDFEDGVYGEPMQHVYIEDNVLDGWGWSSALEAHAIVGDTGVGMVWSDIIVSGNALTRGYLGSAGTAGGTAGVISFYGDDPKTGLQVLGNTSDHTESSPPATTWAWRFKNTTGLVVTGNTQLISGTAVFCHLDNCPGAVTTPNTN